MRRPTASGAGSANRRPSTSWASPSSAANPAGANSCSSGRPGATACGRSCKEIKEELRRRMHQPIPEQGKWLRQVVSGYFNYHAVPTNSRALGAFRHHVTDLWRRTLRRRSQKDGHDLGADDEAGRRLAPQTAHPSSLAEPTLRRQTPEVGAVCGNRARTDLCGGRSVMSVPTAIERSETHHCSRREMMGIASLHPSYAVAIVVSATVPPASRSRRRRARRRSLRP